MCGAYRRGAGGRLYVCRDPLGHDGDHVASSGENGNGLSYSWTRASTEDASYSELLVHLRDLEELARAEGFLHFANQLELAGIILEGEPQTFAQRTRPTSPAAADSLPR